MKCHRQGRRPAEQFWRPRAVDAAQKCGQRSTNGTPDLGINCECLVIYIFRLNEPVFEDQGVSKLAVRE